MSIAKWNLKEAIQINLILSLLISVALINKIKKDVDVAVLKRFIVSSIPGLFIGILIFTKVNATTLKMGLGALILILTFLLICQVRLVRSRRRDYLVGGLSGAFTTGIGMPGPPLLLYFTGTATEKEQLRATTLMFYLYIYSASLLIQVIFAGTTKTVWVSSGLALPLIFLGLYTGQRLFTMIPQRIFQLLMYGILVVTALMLLLSS